MTFLFAITRVQFVINCMGIPKRRVGHRVRVRVRVGFQVGLRVGLRVKKKNTNMKKFNR